MEDDNSDYCIQNPIFQDSNGTKYAVNPFATGENQAKQSTRGTGDNLKISSQLTFKTKSGQNQDTLNKKQRLHQCKDCKTSFRRMDHLKRHIESVHSNAKFLTCPVCGRDYIRQDMLQKHIKRQHSSEKEVFNCRDCKFQCETMSDLEIHENGHQLSERHICPHCKSLFKRKDHMVRHVKSQHMSTPVECPICGQKYKRKDHVARHVREKHNMGLYNGKIIT